MVPISFRYCDIPKYLHAGDFFRSLDKDDPKGMIEVPKNCYAWHNKRKPSGKEFDQLLRIMTFWMLDEIPEGVLFYCSKHHYLEWRNAVATVPAGLKDELTIAYYDSHGVPLIEVSRLKRFDLLIHAVRRLRKDSKATCFAAAYGDLPLLRLLHEEKFVWHVDTCFFASKHGHVKCLQYVHTNGCTMNAQVCMVAAAKGHVNCLKYVLDNGLRDWHTNVCSHAARHGKLECLQVARQHGCPWDVSTIIGAIEGDHMSCLEYALANGCAQGPEASVVACQRGSIASLQLLNQYEGHLYWTVNTTFHAAALPLVDCLRYLHENNCPWDESTLSNAVSHGRHHNLRFALERECPRGDDLVRIAAQSDNIACLLQLVEEGLYMDETVFIAALLKGDPNRMKHLLDQGCPYLQARFNDSDESKVWYNSVYVPRNVGFLSCVETAVERGWIPDENFRQYLVVRDPYFCARITGGMPYVQQVPVSNVWGYITFWCGLVLYITVVALFRAEPMYFVMILLGGTSLILLPLGAYLAVVFVYRSLPRVTEARGLSVIFSSLTQPLIAESARSGYIAVHTSESDADSANLPV